MRLRLRRKPHFGRGKIVSDDWKFIKCEEHGVQPMVVADESCGGMECRWCVATSEALRALYRKHPSMAIPDEPGERHPSIAVPLEDL